MRKILWVIPCVALSVVFASSLWAAQPDLAAADELVAPAETVAQAAGQQAPPTRAAQIPTVSQAQSDAELLERWKAAQAAIAANAWVLKVPHVKGMMPMWIIDQNVPRDEAIMKGIGETVIRVWVDEPENVREVEGQVPSQLGGVPVVVEANPTNFTAW